MEKFRVSDRFILGKLNELIGAEQHLRAEGCRHRASADVRQHEAVRLSPFIQMRNGYWDSAIPGKWSANRKQFKETRLAPYFALRRNKRRGNQRLFAHFGTTDHEPDCIRTSYPRTSLTNGVALIRPTKVLFAVLRAAVLQGVGCRDHQGAGLACTSPSQSAALRPRKSFCFGCCPVAKLCSCWLSGVFFAASNCRQSRYSRPR